MKKIYYVFGDWRKKDVDFINNLDVSKQIDLGIDSFSIKEGNDYAQFLDYYSNKDSLFSKTRPKEFRIEQASCIFSEEELDNANHYALDAIYQKNNGCPEPQNSLKYQDIIFKYDNKEFGTNKTQIAPFSVKKPKWSKTQKGFHLDLEFEFVFFKKDFYQEVLAPLGLKSMEVIEYKTGRILEDAVQLVIPIAKSKLLLENSAYDIHPLKDTGGKKQYALQILDFFPHFEKEFDFHICYSQEELLRGHRKIIISKEFCKTLLKHKVIKYDPENLTPLKKK